MLAFKGQPADGGLYTEYNVLRDGQIIGSIGVGGYFTKNVGVSLTAEECERIKGACKRVYEMPSEYGCFGVGEPPTTPFEQSGASKQVIG